jgi:hypothetical protein
MAKLPDLQIDPTLEAVEREIERHGNSEPARPYLGASLLGQKCDRRIWLQFRWAMKRLIPAKGLRAIEDGHRTEDLMAERLRRVPGIELWTRDPDTGRQIGFKDNHLAGNLDGLIVGLIQAPKALHVWEHKTVNEEKWGKLVKLKDEKGEKNALEHWDEVYFAQAQVYMNKMGADRHYLTVDTPGGRATTSCRTEYQPTVALRYLARAERIALNPRLPSKISENPGWYECKLCDFYQFCHGKSPIERNCRTCMYSTALPDGTWSCEEHQRGIEEGRQRVGCPDHLFHPDLVKGKPVKRDHATVTYEMEDGTTWVNSKQFMG